MSEPSDTRLKSALRVPGGLGAFWFALGSPSLVELSLAANPQAIVIDIQHGLWTRPTLEYALGLVPPAIPTIARLSNGSDTAIAEALDAGAEAVLVPLVETAEQTASCVAAARFPPVGRRSGGGVRPIGTGFVRYVAEAARRTTVGVMIETAAGVAAAEAIAAVPGLDFVFIGTGDLALSLGCFPAVDARHDAACRRVFEACRANDVPCGIFTVDVASAARRRTEGYALTVVANDISIAAAGFREAVATFEAGVDAGAGPAAAFPGAVR